MVIVLFFLLALAACGQPAPPVVDRAAALVSAARADSASTLESLLADGVSPDTLVPDGSRPLTEAARNDRLAAVAALIKAGARPDLPDSTGARPVDYAVALGHRDVAELLVLNAAQSAGMGSAASAWFTAAGGKDDSVPDWHRVLDGELASLGLCYAVLQQRSDLVSSLRRAAGIPNRTGYSALALAARWGDDTAVGALLAAGANPDAEANNRVRETPLMDAARDGYIGVAERLIRGGARVDRADANRETALTWAVRAGETEYARRLLAAGANPRLRNREGLSSLDIARRINHQDLIALLSAPRTGR